jgi:hypothetical protein
MFMDGGDPFHLSDGCGTIDGMPASCSEVSERMDAGSVAAEFMLHDADGFHRFQSAFASFGVGVFAVEVPYLKPNNEWKPGDALSMLEARDVVFSFRPQDPTPFDKLLNKAKSLRDQEGRNDCHALVEILKFAATTYDDLGEAVSGLAVVLAGGNILDFAKARILGERDYRPSPRVAFGSVGFRPNLKYGDDDNQVEHFTGGLLAGFARPGRALEMMNSREGNDPHALADKALNEISVPLGTSIQEHIGVRNGGAGYLNTVADEVDKKVCDK